MLTERGAPAADDMEMRFESSKILSKRIVQCVLKFRLRFYGHDVGSGQRIFRQLISQPGEVGDAVIPV